MKSAENILLLLITGVLVQSFVSGSERLDKEHERMLQVSRGGLPRGITNCEASYVDASLNTFHSAAASIYEHQQKIFCANGGFCKAIYKDDPYNPCVCLEGFSGPHCEFEGSDTDLPKCTMQCHHGGVCRIGAQSWNELLQYDYKNSTPEEMQFCDCPEGVYGKNCEHDVKNQTRVICGDKPCLYGGSCIETVDENGVTSYKCDCSKANIDGVQHAGLYCEHKATSTCSNEQYYGKQFCVNGGTCKSESHLGCDCPPGFVGPLCEFKDLDIDTVECDLQCLNQGICRKGSKDYSIMEKYGFGGNRRGLLDSTSASAAIFNSDFEHCVCPIGFVGLRCEHQLDMCPGGEKACLNGGQCKTYVEDRKVAFECDCSKALSDTARYAGDFCEYPSTQFCTVDGKMPLGGPFVNAFCTNGGTCKGFVHVMETHPGCDCPQGFHGENCQYISSQSSVKKGKNIALSCILIAMVLAFFLIVIMFYKRRQMQIKSESLAIDSSTNNQCSDQMMEESKNQEEQINFENDDIDNQSVASSKAGSTTSSKRNHLKKSKKKKFSTMDRTMVDFLDDNSIPDTNASNKDGVMKTNQTPWPNAIKNPTDTTSIFNEIDLGDDYGVNLVV